MFILSLFAIVAFTLARFTSGSIFFFSSIIPPLLFHFSYSKSRTTLDRSPHLHCWILFVLLSIPAVPLSCPYILTCPVSVVNLPKVFAILQETGTGVFQKPPSYHIFYLRISCTSSRPIPASFAISASVRPSADKRKTFFARAIPSPRPDSLPFTSPSFNAS